MTTQTRPLVALGATVAAVLRRCPEAIVVFTRHRMACPGCGFASFDTLGDAADAYGLERRSFLEEILTACSAGRGRERVPDSEHAVGGPERRRRSRTTER